MSGLIHLKLPIISNEHKPKQVPLSTISYSSVVHPYDILQQSFVPSREHCQHYGYQRPLSLINAIQYGNLSPAFTLSSFKFLNDVYDILDEHQEQFQDFIDWVPTVLHKYQSDLAAHLQQEIEQNLGECLTTILSSTNMTIPTTSCFANEYWLDQSSMDACLDAFDSIYNTSGNSFIFTISLSDLVSRYDDTSDWSAFHNRTFDVKSLIDIIGVLPLKVEDCKGKKSCGCHKRGGCKKMRNCKCDDHCICNHHDGCEHTKLCDCLPDHWAYFRLDLRRSAFYFGDSLNNGIPKARITKVKKFIAMTIQPLGSNINPDIHWPTKMYNMPQQPKDSGSCGVIVLNTIQHAFDPLTPIWTSESNQEHRAHMLKLASSRKVIVI
ncbi:hypothetical protein BGX24_005206 [Mortierella sp. AD032]|nr:hypothetical protein BGX24_005206 [Mortierella sp. AD032]